MLLSSARLSLLISFVSTSAALVAAGLSSTKLNGAPAIKCEASRIRLSIQTNEPFGGNVYAKGYFHRENCRVRGNGVGNTANISIPINSDCGMRRRRNFNPHGIVLEMTVIVMFHDKFLTRNDRAYKLECLYVEINQQLRNALTISDMAPADVSDVGNKPPAIPKCTYEVLTREDDGAPVSFATLGQPIFHRWTCETVAAAAASVADYCLIVHSCDVDDGQGNVQRLVDQNGCSLDAALLGDIEYRGALEAGRTGHVFKFADQPTVYFSCQIRLSMKSDWVQKCERPNCDEIRRLANAPAGTSAGGGRNSSSSNESRRFAAQQRTQEQSTPNTATSTQQGASSKTTATLRLSPAAAAAGVTTTDSTTTTAAWRRSALEEGPVVVVDHHLLATGGANDDEDDAEEGGGFASFAPSLRSKGPLSSSIVAVVDANDDERAQQSQRATNGQAPGSSGGTTTKSRTARPPSSSSNANVGDNDDEDGDDEERKKAFNKLAHNTSENDKNDDNKGKTEPNSRDRGGAPQKQRQSQRQRVANDVGKDADRQKWHAQRKTSSTENNNSSTAAKQDDVASPPPASASAEEIVGLWSALPSPATTATMTTNIDDDVTLPALSVLKHRARVQLQRTPSANTNNNRNDRRRTGLADEHDGGWEANTEPFEGDANEGNKNNDAANEDAARRGGVIEEEGEEDQFRHSRSTTFNSAIVADEEGAGQVAGRQTASKSGAGRRSDASATSSARRKTTTTTTNEDRRSADANNAMKNRQKPPPTIIELEVSPVVVDVLDAVHPIDQMEQQQQQQSSAAAAEAFAPHRQRIDFTTEAKNVCVSGRFLWVALVITGVALGFVLAAFCAALLRLKDPFALLTCRRKSRRHQQAFLQAFHRGRHC